MSAFHTPVLLKEIIDFLDVKKGRKYIDATLGGGGHTVEILKRGGLVLGIDCDQEAIFYTSGRWNVESRKWKIKEENLILVQGNFRNVDEIAHLKGFDKVSGIIFDLGVSSHQLETAERGFSFLKEAPLDMRMDKSLNVRALDLINILTKGELYELFTKLGEERNAHAISNNIVRARRIGPIKTTMELARIIRSASRQGGQVSRGEVKIDPATKVFQALRIAVNDELNSLKQALPKTLALLNKNGILAIISFHSLEDRIVKNTFLQFQKEGFGRILTKKPIIPSFKEREQNRRSRSAKLRVFMRINS